jgi:predicted CXXCH cytochrome family protein
MAFLPARGVRLASAAAALLLAAACGRAPSPVAAQYVGSGACAGCHAAQARDWQASQHAHAMQAAGDTVMPGGPGGGFSPAYTFGVYPLQQFLVPYRGGRLQAWPQAWDTRPAAQGGQRWFDLQAGELAQPGEARHWTGRDQNWNYMCADCHSTKLRRNYDAAQDRYASSWSELAVGCEACHGPGSRHLARAQDRRGADKGLDLALDERRGVDWARGSGGEPARSRPLATHREVETCAACHSRRRPLGDDPTPTGHLLDSYEPVLLDPGLYYPDGQQEGEVYIYGSFLQSRMYAAGVSCSDCHEPHSGRLRAEGNALCTQCHEAARYDATAHHMHPPGSAGTQCVNCHMPARTYMQIDPRRDHSLRVPRPDLSVQLGVPNACNDCHADQGAQWSAAAIEKAHGPQRQGYQHYAGTLDLARRGAPGAHGRLLALAADHGSPGIARATAVAALGAYPDARSYAALHEAASDADPLLRDAALEAALSFPPQQRAALALQLAGDPLRAVRIKAGHALAAVPDALLDAAQRSVRERAYDAYRASELASAERPEAHLNLGSIAAERGEPEEARTQYRAALKLDPHFVPAWADLAELERAAGNEALSGAVLEEGLHAVPDDPTLLHLGGLRLVRLHQLPQALELLRRAAAGAPDNARYAYVYAVALHSAGRNEQALAELERALQAEPYSVELLGAAMDYAREAGNTGLAVEYAKRHAELAQAN